MNEPDLRKILAELEVDVVHKNHRGWLVAGKWLARFARSLMFGGMQFRVIPQEPDFEISEDGTIIRRHTASQPSGWGARLGKPIALRRNDGRYLRVKLNGRVYQVHVLVCAAFHGMAPTGKPFALHADDQPHSNHWTNLRWGTKEDNLADARRNGRILSGERASRVKLTWAKVDEIRSLKGTVSERKLARRLGIPRATINWILSGRSWHESTRPI